MWSERRETFFLIAIFTVPETGQEFYSKRRRDILDVLLKYREIDAKCVSAKDILSLLE